jgi:hypothetical protein
VFQSFNATSLQGSAREIAYRAHFALIGKNGIAAQNVDRQIIRLGDAQNHADVNR